MTILALRSLHAILGDAIEDIERVYTNHGYSTNSTSASSKSSSENLSLSQHREGHQENGQTIGRNSTTSTSQAYVSPPPSPSQTSGFSFDSPVDFPSLDTPCNPGSVSEGLTAHPAVQGAISRIVAAAGQMAATVQNPFLTICDATMGVSPLLIREKGDRTLTLSLP